MALTDNDLAWVRSKVGTSAPTTAELNETFDRLGTKEAVVREVLDTRLANLTASPAQFSVSGEYSQDVSANIKALQDQLGSSDINGITQAAPDYLTAR